VESALDPGYRAGMTNEILDCRVSRPATTISEYSNIILKSSKRLVRKPPVLIWISGSPLTPEYFVTPANDKMSPAKEAPGFRYVV
jgi:hypothetical protein